MGACAECKRRKRKCTGGIPCAMCVSHDIECSLVADGACISPFKSMSSIITIKKTNNNNNVAFGVAPLNPISLELGVDFELSKYFNIFAYNLPTPVLAGVNWSELEKPTTQSHYFAKYAMCALTARACGNVNHANTLISDARVYAANLGDEVSLASLTGFMLLAVYWLGKDFPLVQSTGDIALKLYHKLRKSTALPVTVMCAISLYQFIMRTSPTQSSENKFRIDSFLTSTVDVVPEDSQSEFMVTQIRLCAKVFGQSRTNEVSCVLTTRIDITTVMDSHVSFTEAQRTDILSEIATCRSLCTKPGFYAIDVIEILVDWKTGRTALALAKASTFAENAAANLFLFGTTFELSHLMILSLFLYEHQQFALTQKLFDIATTLHSRICSIIPLFDSSSVLESFILDCFSSAPFPFSQDSPSPPVIHGMVQSMLALISPFLTSGTLSLLSPRGMFVLYKSLSSFCPSSRSSYELFPLANVRSNYTFSPEYLASPSSLLTSPSSSFSPAPLCSSPSSPTYSTTSSPFSVLDSPSLSSFPISQDLSLSTQHPLSLSAELFMPV